MDYYSAIQTLKGKRKLNHRKLQTSVKRNSDLTLTMELELLEVKITSEFLFPSFEFLLCLKSVRMKSLKL